MSAPKGQDRPQPGESQVEHGYSRLSEQDLHLFNEGTHLDLYEKLGAHPARVSDRAGTSFGVWAPDAIYVSVVGDFNDWDRQAHPLDAHGATGVWQGFIPGVEKGCHYKYFIESRYRDYEVEKADPFGFLHETPPKTASVVWELDYDWGDDQWMEQRADTDALQSPVSIYEVHLGSWMRAPDEAGRALSYREIAPKLAEHVEKCGFTHVELMPVMEHPFYGSWGYQCTGYFAASSRYGTPQDLMYLIDHLHGRGIGVILDWVPSHFPADEHGLAYFDGTNLYEHADLRKGFHPDWKSLIFNYGRNEVRSFLASNAMYWLEVFHADGLRVDAVASMLYLDYSREPGQWVPNRFGGRENLEAVDFLRFVNESVYERFPGVHLIAEESTAWPMVSRPTYIGGLGFGMKWDMGWMHDTLEYMSQDPVHRKYHHDDLTFRGVYAFNENFVLPLSHDEVVHGKGSLLEKMPGDDWQKFANLRLLYAYMFAQPGKKLLFMGGEFAQRAEWNHDQSLDWHLLDQDCHAGVQRLIADLNHLYRSNPALHRHDFEPTGFEWIDTHDTEQSVLSFLRKGERRRADRPEDERLEDEATSDVVACVFNFTPVPRHNYRIGVPRRGRWVESLNTDAGEYWVGERREKYDGRGAGRGSSAHPIPRAPVFNYVDTAAVGSVVSTAPRGLVMQPIIEGKPPLGCQYLGDSRAHFVVWGPRCDKLEVHLLQTPVRTIEMQRVGQGYFAATVDGVEPGTRYYIRVDGEHDRPDPASRCQPMGVHGPSEVLARQADNVAREPRETRDDGPVWPGMPLRDYIIYELHLGAFSAEGTFAGAIDRLDELVELGITAVELMPVAAFPGRRNWGYDGVQPFAVHEAYGGPDGLKRFVRACHRRGLAVVLDVVYNHLGPEGNYLHDFGPYFTYKYRTPWGDAINFDGPESDHVRRYFLQNAAQWFDEFGVDALRLDAVHAIFDDTPMTFLEELRAVAEERAARLGRPAYLLAETHANDPALIRRPELGGVGMHAHWSDDFHHAVHTLLTGESQDYYCDYGELEHLAGCLRDGYSYTGQYSPYRRRRHGQPPTGLGGERFVVCIQNHDQVGNRPYGKRLTELVSFEQLKLAAATLLCSPFVPLLFMGEEYAEPAPFPYFISHGDPDLIEAVRQGRKAEFRSLEHRGVEQRDEPPDPAAEQTFLSAKLDHELKNSGRHQTIWNLYRELLSLRKNHPALCHLDREQLEVTTFQMARTIAVRRWYGDRQVLILANFGDTTADLELQLPPAIWQKRLETCAEQWAGPGATADELLDSTRPSTVSLALSAHSAAVFDASKD